MFTVSNYEETPSSSNDVLLIHINNHLKHSPVEGAISFTKDSVLLHYIYSGDR